VGAPSFPPRARARHDEQRAALVHDGSALLRIESVEEGVYREGGHLNRVGGRADKRGAAAPFPNTALTRSHLGTDQPIRPHRDGLVTQEHICGDIALRPPGGAWYGLFWPS
jgi:hypothetical protein